MVSSFELDEAKECLRLDLAELATDWADHGHRLKKDLVEAVIEMSVEVHKLREEHRLDVLAAARCLLQEECRKLRSASCSTVLQWSNSVHRRWLPASVRVGGV